MTTTIKDTDILVIDAEVTNVFIDMNTGKVVPVDNEIISLWTDLGKHFNKDKSLFSKSTNALRQRAQFFAHLRQDAGYITQLIY